MPWVLDNTEEDKPKQSGWVLADNQPVTAEGIGKAIVGSGIPKGIAGIMGTPAALDQMSRAATEWLASKIAGQPVQMPQGVPGPMAALLGAGATVPPQQVQSNIEQVTGPLYQPQNRAEKFADTATQFAMGMGRPSVKSLITALAGAGGTEAAGAATGDKPLARFAGGLLGAGAPTAVNAWMNAPAKAVQQAVGSITPAEIANAEMRQESARLLGVPLMGAESMPNSGLQQLASNVNASRQGAPVMQQFLDQRPNQVRSAVGGLLSDIGPVTTPDQTSQMAQKAATDAISSLIKQRSNLTRPMYEAAANDKIPADQLNSLFADIRQKTPTVDPAYARALNNFVGDLTVKKPAIPAGSVLDASGRPFVPEVPASVAPKADVAPLSSTYVKTREQLGIPNIQATQEDRIAQGILGPYNKQLGSVLEANSPQWAAANDVYKQFTAQKIDPMRAGPVGRVAGEGFTPADAEPIKRITNVIGDAQTARPDTIRELYTTLNQQDRAAFPAVARTYLENAFDTATQKVQSGDNRMMGANFAKSVIGTDQQRANFDEILRGVAQAHGVPPDQLIGGAKVLMQTLEATGKVPGIGSQTATRLDQAAQLGQTVIGDAAGALSTRPLGWIKDRYNAAVMGSRYKQLAQILTAPDSVQQIVKMAKLKPDGLTAQYYASQLFSGVREGQ